MKLLRKTTAFLPVLLLLLAAVLPGNRAEALKPVASPAAKKPPAAAAAEPQAKPPESLSYGRFGQVAIYRSSPHPKNVVLFLSGDGGWNLGVVDMARILSSMDSLVVGINAPQYVKKLNASKERCVYPASDLELLSKFVQKTFGFPTYVPPVLVGYSSGATLAYAILAQAPPNTYRGAISLGFCPDLDLQHPFCAGHGIASVPGPKNKGLIFKPTATLEEPWISFQGTIDQVCNKDDMVRYVSQVKNGEIVLLPDVGHGFSKTYKWEPQLRQSYQKILNKSPIGSPAASANPGTPAPAAAKGGVPAVNDLPLVEVPVKSGTASTMMAVVVSGDGGWAGLDKEVAGALSTKGIPVVGVNSLQYFWKARTPEGIAKDLDRILRHYMATWNRQEVMLIGYSLGADVLPFAASRLPADLLGKVKVMALLGPSTKAEFEFHVSSWLGGGDSEGQPVLPEVKKLGGRPPILCLHGSKESDSLCPSLTAAQGKSVELPGAHHFGGDYEAVANLILKEAQQGK
ncbi:MAG TPA: AcvB/VirJ family lysyl-phosphatidylglycerol hydrolase [Thermoanaerobaculia bacterium]|jgi:type IV secretory pathway VirJ component|nr:AcvB/VirJ family lysyl-phosphatidylglycerol hydrolase [Thermoanaerobaculia bacterium]